MNKNEKNTMLGNKIPVSKAELIKYLSRPIEPAVQYNNRLQVTLHQDENTTIISIEFSDIVVPSGDTYIIAPSVAFTRNWNKFVETLNNKRVDLYCKFKVEAGTGDLYIENYYASEVEYSNRTGVELIFPYIDLTK